MTADAALYLATPDDARAALSPVAGRPVAFRMVAAAVRAGCRRVWVPGVLRATRLEAALARSPTVRAAVRWMDAERPAPGPLLLLPAAALVPPSAVAALAGAEPPALLAASADSDAPVAMITASLAGALWPLLAASLPLSDALGLALKEGVRHTVHGVGWYVRGASRRDLAEAERRLYAGLGSVVDTRLDQLVHRRLSRFVSRWAVRWNASPHLVTLGSLLVGLGAAWCFWEATPLRALGGLALYALAVVLDHADGEVARLALAESALGAWLDVLADTTVHAALMVALGATAQHAAGSGLTAGLLAAAGAVASAAVTQTAPPQPMGAGAVLDALSNRDGFYGMLLGFILSLAVLPELLPALMVLVAAGCHAFWVSQLALRVARSRR